MSICYLCKAKENSWPFIKASVNEVDNKQNKEISVQIHILCQTLIPKIDIVKLQHQYTANFTHEQLVNNDLDPCLICNEQFTEDKRGFKVKCQMQQCKHSIHLGCLPKNNLMYLKRNGNKCCLICQQHIDQFNYMQNISFEQLTEDVEKFISYNMSFLDLNHINVMFNEERPKDGIQSNPSVIQRKRGRPQKSKQIMNQSVKDMFNNFIGEQKGNELSRIKQMRLHKTEEKYDQQLRNMSDYCESYLSEFSNYIDDGAEDVWQLASDYPNQYEDRYNQMKKWWDKINQEYFNNPDAKVLSLFQNKDAQQSLIDCLNYKDGEKTSKQKLEINIYSNVGLKRLQSSYHDNEMLPFKIKKYFTVLFETQDDTKDVMEEEEEKKIEEDRQQQLQQQKVIEQILEPQFLTLTNEQLQQQSGLVADNQKSQLNQQLQSKPPQPLIIQNDIKQQLQNTSKKIQKQIDNKYGFLAIYSYNDQADCKAIENSVSTSNTKSEFQYLSSKDIKSLCEYKIIESKNKNKNTDIKIEKSCPLQKQQDEEKTESIQVAQNAIINEDEDEGDMLVIKDIPSNLDKLEENQKWLASQETKLNLNKLIYLDKQQYKNAIDSQITILSVQNIINKRKQENRQIKSHLNKNDDNYSLDELAYNIIYLKHILQKKTSLTEQSKAMQKIYKDNRKAFAHEQQVQNYVNQHQKWIDISHYLCVIRTIRSGFQEKAEFNTLSYFKNLERCSFKRSQNRSQLTMCNNSNQIKDVNSKSELLLVQTKQGEEIDENSGGFYGDKETEQNGLKQNETYHDKLNTVNQSDKTLQFILEAVENNNNQNNSEDNAEMEEEEAIFHTEDKQGQNKQFGQEQSQLVEKEEVDQLQNNEIYEQNNNLTNVDQFAIKQELQPNEEVQNNIDIEEESAIQVGQSQFQGPPPSAINCDNNNITKQEISQIKQDEIKLEVEDKSSLKIITGNEQGDKATLNLQLYATPQKSEININIVQNSQLQSSSAQKEKKFYNLKKRKIKKFLDTDCAVCFSNIITDYNPVVYCSLCSISFHKYCYGIIDIPKGKYLCDKCEYMNTIRKKDKDRVESEIQCKICYVDDLPLKKFQEKDFYHPICLFLNNLAILHVGKLYLREEILEKMQNQSITSLEQWLIQNQRLQNLDKVCYTCQGHQGHKQKCGDPQCNNYFHMVCAYLGGENVVVDDSYEQNKEFSQFTLKILCSSHFKEIDKLSQQYYRRFAINYDNICQYENFEQYKALHQQAQSYSQPYL